MMPRSLTRPMEPHERQAYPFRDGPTVADLDAAAKRRALFGVLGPCILRTDDGGAHVLSAEALKIVPFHEAVH